MRFSTHVLLSATLVLAASFDSATALDIIPPYARGGSAWEDHLRARASLNNKNPSAFERHPAGPRTLSAQPRAPLFSAVLFGENGEAVGSGAEAFFPANRVTAGLFSQANDHFNTSDTGRFNQRFYVDTTGVVDPASAPVLLYISGEGPVDAYPTGFYTSVGYANGAVVCTLEHRFYGPEFPENSKSVHALRLLTVEQALADLNAFHAYVLGHISASTNVNINNNNNNNKLNKFNRDAALFVPSAPPVPESYVAQLRSSAGLSSAAARRSVIVGGSYSGALSTWYKEVFSSDVVGSWSSSGVVNAIVNYVEFDEQIAKSAGPECAAALRATMAAVEADLDAARAAFNATSLTIDTDFLYMVADSLSMMIQYNQKSLLCPTIVNARRGGLDLVSVLASLTVKVWGPSFSTGCFYDTGCLIRETDSPDMARSWRWQKCTELYYLQAAPRSSPIRSARLTLDSLVDQCNAIFATPARGTTPSSDAFNNRYGGARPLAANPGLWADASDDPWQTASIDASLSETQPYFYSNCDDCGHCSDLQFPKDSDPKELTATRNGIKAVVDAWFAGN